MNIVTIYLDEKIEKLVDRSNDLAVTKRPEYAAQLLAEMEDLARVIGMEAAKQRRLLQERALG